MYAIIVAFTEQVGHMQPQPNLIKIKKKFKHFLIQSHWTNQIM